MRQFNRKNTSPLGDAIEPRETTLCASIKGDAFSDFRHLFLLHLKLTQTALLALTSRLHLKVMFRDAGFASSKPDVVFLFSFSILLHLKLA